MYTFKLSSRKNAWGEWVVLCYLDGKRYPEGDYHTNDKEDAIDTTKSLTNHAILAKWLENANHDVSYSDTKNTILREKVIA